MSDFQLEDHSYYRTLYDAQKSVNIYFLTSEDKKSGQPVFCYVCANAMLHDEFMQSIKMAIIPHFAVVVEKGYGAPDDTVKEKMKSYYGFDHARAEEARAAASA